MSGYRIDHERGETHGGAGVAFIGAHGRLLRVRVRDTGRRKVRVRCPDCGGLHETGAAMARPLRDGEAPPDLVEATPPDEPTAPAEPSTPAKPAASQRVPDSAIIAALSRDEDRKAPEVAAALGYAGTDSLVRRIGRMNAAAGSTLIHIRRGHPTTLRLA